MRAREKAQKYIHFLLSHILLTLTLLKYVVRQEQPEQQTVVAKYFRATRVNGESTIRYYIRRVSPKAAEFGISLFVISPLIIV